MNVYDTAKTPSTASTRETIWQQAEQARGTADEVGRIVRLLVERTFTNPGSDAASAPMAPSQTRAGVIGVLDGVTNDLAEAVAGLKMLLAHIGEGGQAPTNISGYAERPR